MELEEFKKFILGNDPQRCSESFLTASTVSIFPNLAGYQTFQSEVKKHLPQSDSVIIAGSGNWGYSLNPYKFLIPFHQESDIDVAVISPHYFNETWDIIRTIDRKVWQSLNQENRQKIRRNGENIYAGFATPKWIPEASHPYHYNFRSITNKLSSEIVGYREVNMMFFKNFTETIDYYQRGFILAQGRL